MKNILFYAILLITLTACHTKSTKPVVDSTAIYTVPDEKAIKQTVDNAYSAISFNKGEQPKFDELRKYCIPQAQFIQAQSDSVSALSLNQFLYLHRTMIEGKHIQYFHETSNHGKAEQFGNVATYISSYTTYINKPDSLTEKGVDFFHLIKIKGAWKISGDTWDVERKGLKIPAYYLKK